jgi:hypothetical protein
MVTKPLRQRSAAEQSAAGVIVPYWHPADRDHEPITYHLTLVKLDITTLRRLTVLARIEAAGKDHLRNPLDNRMCLDYPARDREMVNFLRHTALNRGSDKQAHLVTGYTNSFDNLLSKIERKGIDVEARQLDLRLAVLRLIAETYPELGTECADQAWITTTKPTTRRNHNDH